MKRGRDDAGTSLIEIVVASAVMAVVLAIVFAAFGSSVDRVNALDRNIGAVSDARIAVDRFTRELRQAYTGLADVPVIAEMTSTRITFYAADRSTPLRLRKVTYQLAAGTITRSETLSADSNPPTGPAGAAVTQVAGVTNGSLFAYFDHDGHTATTADSVATVKLAVVLAPVAAGASPQQLGATVKVRANR